MAVATCGLAASAGLVAGVDLLAGTAGASASGASAVVAATRKAILAETAVRVTSTARSTKTHKVTETAVFDAGRTSSEQRYAASSARVAIRLTPTDAFFSGNKSGLTSMFAMPANDVAKVGSKWVDVKSSETQYKDFSSAVLASIPGDFLPGAAAKHLRLTTATRAGTKDHVLAWTATANGITGTFRLWVPATGHALPVQETERQGTTTQLTTFGHWNEHLVVAAPKRVIAYKSLIGG